MSISIEIGPITIQQGRIGDRRELDRLFSRKISRELHAPFTGSDETEVMKRILSTLLLFLLFLIPATSCSRHPRVTVVNASADPLTNLVLSGSGFSELLGSLAPGEQKTVEVRPSADTGLAVTFEAKSTTHTPPADGYFEASGLYRVRATVQPDFSVKVESEIR
jgi:hypothetical protein